MNQNIIGVLISLVAYFVGALPFSIWITRAVKGVDVRDAGSKHATTTNTLRQAGLLPGIVVLILDLLKGFIPVYFARQFGPDWSVVFAGMLVVVGHCWPIYAQFKGGMGLAAAGGALLAINPYYFLITLAILIALTLIIKHSARAAMLLGILMPFIVYLIDKNVVAIFMGMFMGLTLTFRFYSDYNREYKELWLDRDKP